MMRQAARALIARDLRLLWARRGDALQPALFALLTVVTWGLYGVFLHQGQTSMQDPINGRYRAFLFVGIAYMVTAVLAPLFLLVARGASWQFPVRGVVWSLIAGLMGAAGAFCVLLAFGAKGSPSVVMSIVFAGAPVVNALTALAMHPPEGGLRALPWQQPDASREELFSADLGVTAVQWAIAETGTLVLVSDEERHRLASLLPPVHIALLPRSRILANLGETLKTLRRPLSPAVTFVTGPSRTADIELQLVIGVHGPRELHVVVV